MFRKYIVRQLKKHRLSVSALARESGMSRTGLSNFVNGHKGITVDNLEGLIRALRRMRGRGRAIAAEVASFNGASPDSATATPAASTEEPARPEHDHVV